MGLVCLICGDLRCPLTQDIPHLATSVESRAGWTASVRKNFDSLADYDSFRNDSFL